jgi:hypothetical protein
MKCHFKTLILIIMFNKLAHNMRLFNTNKLDLKASKSIYSIVSVEQLTSFDMIYVYHLLSKGTKLNLIKSEDKLNGDLVYKVKFNTFQLGYITLSRFSKLLFKGCTELDATIFGMAKEKYLPLKSLELMVGEKTLKMVS